MKQWKNNDIANATAVHQAINYLACGAEAVAKYCNEHVYVCVSVCLSASMSPKPHARSLQIFFQHVVYRHGSVLFWRVDEIPRGRGSLKLFFFLIDNALYSIAFGTHTKTAELIWMPFGMMTRVGPRYHVLDGGPGHPRGRGNLWGNVAAHCKVMGHSTVSCAKTAEPTEMSFGMKTRMGPRNQVLYMGVDPPGGSVFGGCPTHSKALAIFLEAVAATSLRRSLQKGSFNRQ